MTSRWRARSSPASPSPGGVRSVVIPVSASGRSTETVAPVRRPRDGRGRGPGWPLPPDSAHTRSSQQRRWGMAMTGMKREMFVGGEWVPSTSGETEDVLNPATGEVLATVPRGSEEDVDRAVAAARRAFDEVWFDTTPGERSGMLLKLADAVDQHAEELAALESANVGKPRATPRSEELPVVSDNLRVFARGGPRGRSGAGGGESGRVSRRLQ